MSNSIPEGAVRSDVEIPQLIAHNIFDSALRAANLLMSATSYLLAVGAANPEFAQLAEPMLDDLKATAADILDAAQDLLPEDQRRDCLAYVNEKVNEAADGGKEVVAQIKQLTDSLKSVGL